MAVFKIDREQNVVHLVKLDLLPGKVPLQLGKVVRVVLIHVLQGCEEKCVEGECLDLVLLGLSAVNK